MTLGWGIVGSGAIVRGHMLDAIDGDPDSRAIGIVSGARGGGAQIASKSGIRCYPNRRSMLADPDIDVVYVASEHAAHAEQVVLACRAGKHVLSEKPLALTLDDAMSAIEAADTTRVILGVNHPLRGTATYQAMHGVIASGEIGEPIAARVCYGLRLDANASNWRLTGPSAGVAFDISVHDVDSLRYLLGRDVEAVVALGSLRCSPAMPSDNLMTLLRFEGGLVASLYDSYTVPHARNGIEIHGTRGSIIGDGVIGGLSVSNAFVVRGDDGERTVTLPDAGELFGPTVHAFNAAVRGRGEPLATGRDGLCSLRVVLAAVESAASGELVSITPHSPSPNRRDQVRARPLG